MTISFSGLTSGLDTSSWIKSLTALKQAKVTTLQQQRETLSVSKNSLSSIRSFFTSFRSTLEKITDSRFNLVSMNLFAQNLATSAKLNVVSATATTEAKEGKYEVKVDKLASNTKAESKNDYKTIVTTSTTATEETYLKDLSIDSLNNKIKSGDIWVNVDGREHLIKITDNETIGSFIEKLKGIGVNASYNEKTGIFSTSISANQINDVGNTGIVAGLHLSTVSSAWETGDLTLEKTETVYVNADEDTLLSKLGVREGVFEITYLENDTITKFDAIVEADDTIGDLIYTLEGAGIEATIENGIFSIKNATITDEGNTDIIDKLGLTNSITQSVQMSKPLVSDIAFSTGIATEETLLTTLQGGNVLKDGDTITVMNDDGVSKTITLNTDWTLGSLFTAFTEAGLDVSISAEGIVSFDGGRFVDDPKNIAHILGLGEVETATNLQATTSTIGITLTSAREIMIKGMTNTSGLISLSSVEASDMISGSTFKISTSEELVKLASIVNNGTSCQGVTFVMSNDIDLSSIENWEAIGESDSVFSGIFDGNGYDIIGMNININTTGDPQGLFGQIGNATIKNINLIDYNISAEDSQAVGALVGIAMGTSTVSNVYTEGSIQAAGAVAGGLVGTTSGSINITSCQASGTISSGDIAGGLVGKANMRLVITSSSADVNVSGKTSGGIVGQASGGGTLNLNSVYAEGTVLGSDISGGLVGLCSGQSVNITNAYFKGYGASDMAQIVGTLSRGTCIISNTYALTTHAISQTSGTTIQELDVQVITPGEQPFTVSARQAATNITTFAELGISNNVKITVMSGGTESVITITSSRRIENLLSSMEQKGFSVSFNDGKVSITGSEGVYIKGELDESLKQALELTDYETCYYVETSGSESSTIVGSNVLYATVHGITTTITNETTLKELGIYNNEDLLIYGGAAGDNHTVYSGSTLADLTVGELLELCSQKATEDGGALTASLENGVITMESPDGYKISGAIATKLGLTTTGGDLFTVTSGASVTSSVAVKYTVYNPATSSTSISDIYTGTNSVITVRTSDGSDVHIDTSTLTSLSSVTAAQMISGRTYKISTTTDLQKLATFVNSGRSCEGVTFVLANDIDMSSSAYLWQGIGVESNAFAGIFDGNNYEIKNCNFDTSESSGIFGYLDGATIKNLGIVGSNIEAAESAGLLAIFAANSNIENVYAFGRIKSMSIKTSCVGGLVGEVVNSSIKNAHSNVTINNGVTNDNSIGGLLGWANAVTIEASSAEVDIRCNGIVGGLVGQIGEASLNSVYSTGTITYNTNNNRDDGGLIGAVANGDVTVQNAYSTATVAQYCGSLVGYVNSGLALSLFNVYTTNSSVDFLGDRIQGTVNTNNVSVISSNELPFTLGIDKTAVDIDITGMTVSEMFNALSPYGVTGSIDSSGVITLSSGSGNIVTGAPIEALGLNFVQVEDTSFAVDMTSTVAISYTTTVAMTETNKLTDYKSWSSLIYSPGGVFDNNGLYHTDILNSDGSITCGSLNNVVDTETGATNYVFISSADDLKAIKAGLEDDKTYAAICFILVEDINWADTGEVFGGLGSNFKGVIDGNGHTINLGSNAESGLFNNLNGTVEDLKITGTITAYSSGGIGAIANSMSGGTIINCETSARVEGGSGSAIGGLVGRVTGVVTISDSKMTGVLSATSNYDSLGGVVGRVSSGTVTIENTSVSHELGWLWTTATSSSGGLIGAVSSGAVANLKDVSFYLGYNQSSNYKLSGLVGYNDGNLNIENALVRTSVTLISAFVGNNSSTGTVSLVNCLTTSTAPMAPVSVATNCCRYDSSFSYGELLNHGFTADRWGMNGTTPTLVSAGLVKNTPNEVITIKVDNYDKYQYTVTQDTTFGELLDWFNSKGIVATMENGSISLSGPDNYMIEGAIATNLGIATGTEIVNAYFMDNISAYEGTTICVGSTLCTTMTVIQNANATIDIDTGSIIGGNTSDGTIVAISTKDELLALGRSGQVYNGIHFILANDIDLGMNSQWKGINLGANSVFDGHGHTITGELYLSYGSDGDFGFFNHLVGATVQNLTFSGELVLNNAAENFGFVGSANDGITNSKIVNVFLRNATIDASVYDVTNLGGVVGSIVSTSVGNASAMNNVDNVALKITTIKASGTITNYGGVAGNASWTKISNILIENFEIENNGTVTYWGGVVGISDFIGIQNVFASVNFNNTGTVNTDNQGYIIGLNIASNNVSVISNVCINGNGATTFCGRGTLASSYQTTNVGYSYDVEGFLSNASTSGATNWYLGTLGNLRLASPGSNIVSYYTPTGKNIGEIIITAGTSSTTLLSTLNRDYFNGREVSYVKTGALDQDFAYSALHYERTKAVYNNTESMTIVETRTLTEDTTWAELGMTANSYYLTLSAAEKPKTSIQLLASETISQTAAKLAEYGISLTVTDGKATFDYDNDESDIYRISYDGTAGYYEIMSMLGIDTTNSSHSTVKPVTTYAESTSSNANTISTTHTLNSATTFKDLGVGRATFTGAVIKNQDDEITTITVLNTETIQSFVDKINSVMGEGTAGISADGKFYINESDTHYIASVGGLSYLKLPSSLRSYHTTTVDATASTITSEQINYNIPGYSTIANTSTKLGVIRDAEGNKLLDYTLNLGSDIGTFTFDADTTIQQVIDELAEQHVTATLGADGLINLSAHCDIAFGGGLGIMFAGDNPEMSGSYNTVLISYTGDVVYTGTEVLVNDTTKLSELGQDITNGNFIVNANGVEYKIAINGSVTIGELRNNLRDLCGIQSSLVETNHGTVLRLFSDKQFSIQETSEGDIPSNIVEKLFSTEVQNENRYDSTQLTQLAIQTNTVSADGTDKLSDFNNGSLKCEGTLSFTIDGVNKSIFIKSDETFNSLIDKFAEVGITATMFEGKLMLNTSGKELVFDANSTSSVVSNLGIEVSTDLSNTSASSEEVNKVTEEEKLVIDSVAAHVGMDTVISSLGMNNCGAFTLLRNNVRAEFVINADTTFQDLANDIKAVFNDVELTFDDEGYLKIYSTTDANIKAGLSHDSSKLIGNMNLNSNGNYLISSRVMYNLNDTTKVVESGVFARGDVTEGTFIVGNAEITIDANTKLDDIIKQINSSADTNATAYWDSSLGKFSIKSRVSGSGYINIEAGTSNFTDIMGFTITERDGDGNIISTKMDIASQDAGSNAEFWINGTKYTSTTNTVGSDVTKIDGVTFDLKDVSNGETVTVTIEKNYEGVADAVQEVVDAYNILIENVDKELFGENGVVSRLGDTVIMSDMTSGGNLKGESTLKLLRNQIRSLMMSSIGGASQFKTLSSIGITTEAASTNNISTANINKLEFNKDKFIEAFRTDALAVEHLLVGNGVQDGILTKVENIVENSVKAVTGYFSSAEKSYTTQIERLDSKIEKANAAVATYKARLEQKFQYMDMMIGKMQEQFSTFLGT